MRSHSPTPPYAPSHSGSVLLPDARGRQRQRGGEANPVLRGARLPVARGDLAQTRWPTDPSAGLRRRREPAAGGTQPGDSE